MQMEKKGSRKKMKNPNRSRIIALACCVLLLVSALISGGFAKYTTQVQSSGEGLPFKAQLFDETKGDETGYFQLVEYNKTTNKDGSTSMGADEVLSNDYYMIPGTAILKLPMVKWTNKTSIPAYLYLVVEGDDSKLKEFEYGIESAWIKIDGQDKTTGIYVFGNGGDSPEKIDENRKANAGISAIAPEEGLWYVFITELQKLQETKTLSFTAYAIQAPGATASVEDAYAVWNANKNGSDKILIDTTAKVVNTFTPGDVKASVDEVFSGTTKSSVKIKNDGNVPALVRARLVVNWVENGDVIANPQGVTDPVVNNIDTTKWTKIGDYYYYNGYVAPGGTTDNLLKEAITSTGTPTLQIEVVAEAIQAAGHADPRTPSNDTRAVALAWHCYYDGSAWHEIQ